MVKAISLRFLTNVNQSINNSACDCFLMNDFSFIEKESIVLLQLLFSRFILVTFCFRSRTILWFSLYLVSANIYPGRITRMVLRHYCLKEIVCGYYELYKSVTLEFQLSIKCLLCKLNLFQTSKYIDYSTNIVTETDD